MAEFPHTPAYTEKCKPCLLCVMFGARSGSDTTVTFQESNVSLLWMPEGHVALASAVFNCGIVECGVIPTPVPVGKLRLDSIIWISSEPRACHTCEDVPGANSLLYRIDSQCLYRVLLLTLRATRAPCRSWAGPPSNLGVTVSAYASTFEYERHRACLSVKTSTDEPPHVPLHARTLRGAALSR